MIIPKHLFAPFAGAKSREAPTNLTPVGTGPYLFREFKPGDLVSAVINPNYHMAEPALFRFHRNEGRRRCGVGRACRAADRRIRLRAWNMQVEDEVLLRMEKGGKGRVLFNPGAGIEHIQVNSTDPWTEVDGERSSIKTTHPTLGDPAVRDALALLIGSRFGAEIHLWPRAACRPPTTLNNPARFASKNTVKEFNVDKAIGPAEKAGWKKGADGIREKGGKKLKYVYQTSINQPRQKTQAIIKQACQESGHRDRDQVGDGPRCISPPTWPTPTPIRISTLTCRCTTPGRISRTRACGSSPTCRPKSPARRTSGRAANITRWRSAEFDGLYMNRINRMERAQPGQDNRLFGLIGIMPILSIPVSFCRVLSCFRVFRGTSQSDLRVSLLRASRSLRSGSPWATAARRGDGGVWPIGGGERSAGRAIVSRARSSFRTCSPARALTSA